MHGRAGAQLSFKPFPVVGMVLLATDLTTERDVRALMPSGIGVYGTRIAFANPTTPTNVRATLPHLADAAALLLPELEIAAIYFSCTSATVTVGQDAVESAVHSTRPGVPVITPISAARNALTALDANDISILTPYVAETADAVVGNFTGVGYNVHSALALGMEDDRKMALLDEEAIIEAAARAMAPRARALFISCTALPAAILVPRIEARLGRPVITSNLAAIWEMARLAGHHLPIPDRGALMRLPLVRKVA